MQTVTVQITNSKALRLLQELEDLHLIRLLPKPQVLPGNSLSEKFGGKLHLSDQEYQDFQQHIANSRNEWENNI